MSELVMLIIFDRRFKLTQPEVEAKYTLPSPVFQSTADSNELEEARQSQSKLQAQVNQYKDVLADTVSTLLKLLTWCRIMYFQYNMNYRYTSYLLCFLAL